MIDSLKKANSFYIILAVCITCFGYFLRAMRWKTLLSPIGKTKIGDLFAATTVGFSVILIIGRAGELVRPMWLSMNDKKIRPSASLVSLGLERIFDLTAIVLLFAPNLIWFRPPAGYERDFSIVRTVGIIMLSGIIAGIISLAIFQFQSESIILWFEKLLLNKRFIPNRLAKLFLSILRQLAKSLEIIRSPVLLAQSVFWTVALWFSVAVPTWLVIQAFDLPLGFMDSIFIMGWAAFGSIVPTPGGAAGAFHAVTAGGLILLGIDPEKAAATAIVIHFVYFFPAIVFGIYYFITGNISLEKLRSLVSSETASEEVEHESIPAI